MKRPSEKDKRTGTAKQRDGWGRKGEKEEPAKDVIMRERVVHAFSVTDHDPIKRAWKACNR